MTGSPRKLQSGVINAKQKDWRSRRLFTAPRAKNGRARTRTGNFDLVRTSAAAPKVANDYDKIYYTVGCFARFACDAPGCARCGPFGITDTFLVGRVLDDLVLPGQQQLEADFVVQGPPAPSPRARRQVVGSSRTDAFAPLEKTARLLTITEGITETEVALACRGAASHRLGEGRRLVSAFEIDTYLGA